MAVLERLRTAFFLSGAGSTAVAALQAIRQGSLKNVEPALFVLSNLEYGKVEKLVALGVSPKNITLVSKAALQKPGRSPKEVDYLFGQLLLHECTAHQVDHICQFGWTPLTPASVVKAYRGRMVNQHGGGLDPKAPGYDFGGKGMIGRATIAAQMYFRKATGCNFWIYPTAHYVGEQLDQGAVIEERSVPIGSDESVDALYQKALAEEHALQLHVLGLFAKGARIPAVEHDKYWLVRPEERALLEQCKTRAIKEYLPIKFGFI